MSETVAPEYTAFVAAERRAQRLAAAVRPTAEGQVMPSVRVGAKQVNELMRVAARRAAGFFRSTKRSEVVWVEGGNELALVIAKVSVTLDAGLLRVQIPVRCDQTGPATVKVLFAVGSAASPAGLYAATSRLPQGPEVVVAAWGDALVAFAWQCVLGLVTGIAAATGKDQRGNLLVPVELSVSKRTLEIVPMARYRFAGGSSLRSGT